ncbi:unnamed protein product [Rodentolepis nana]|uniref:Endo/exonuclease/phosphatase domain-containing protein n=1 Tax=Rodentolepis nana TaxID=102285 RepID=A0A0R3TNP3_RODNA|nr:unnamed protein product [Rodentolepis nana]
MLPITSSSDPPVECWRDVTGQKDPSQENPTRENPTLYDDDKLKYYQFPAQIYDVDIFTIMEANISDDKLKHYQFTGYTLYLLPKHRQVASGILTGVKVGLTSHCDLIKSMGSTQDKCEIIRLNVWKCQNQFKIYAIYNPPKNCPNFYFLTISYKTVVLGDFNAHSTRWGYKDTNIAGKEIEDMLNSNPLELIYSNEDPATYLHYNGTRTTPDLLLAPTDISEHTRRKIIDDPGSGHKPVIAKDELHTSPLYFNQHPDKLCNDIKNIMIRCAQKTIPRGKTKHYRVFWSKHLGQLKRKRDAFRNTADQTGRTEEVQAWRRQSAVLRQAILQAKQTSFDKFISNINYQSDSQRTFKFLGNLQNNRERPRKEPIRLNSKLLTTDTEIANYFARFYSHKQKKNPFVRKSSRDLKMQVRQFGKIKKDIATPNSVLSEPFRPCELNAANVLSEPFRPCELNAAIK